MNKLLELGSARFEPGYWRGLRQPAMLVSLRLTRLEIGASALNRFDAIMDQVCPVQDEAILTPIPTLVADHPVLGRLLRLTLAILAKMQMPVMAGATAIKPDAQDSHDWVVGLPAISESIRAPQAAFRLVCSLMNELAAGKDFKPDALVAYMNKLAKQFRPLAPGGVNTLRFLQAAHELDIPWRHVANNVYQFGWGSRSRWLDSSFTDETSKISASLARDKVACAKLLRDAGLPVPKHQLVATAEQAVKVAEALGYPVVLKPANLDGGAGVVVGLRDAEAVERAFVDVAKLSKRILVEQFIEGNDHRVTVVKDEVLSVVARRPPGVVGDGIHTIRELVDQINTKRANQSEPLEPSVEQGGKPIALDEESLIWLRSKGLGLDSVVPIGVSVRLRGAANWSHGGTTQDVSLQAHPDNLELALRAVAALRLDVAGLDLLVPDITRSWRETGGAICEVNAQPQFTVATRHQQVLARLVCQKGRIPVVGVMLSREGNKRLESLVGPLERDGIRLYVASTALECHEALRHANVDAVIWQMDALPSPAGGMPFDRLSLAIYGQGLKAQSNPLLLTSIDSWSLDESADSNNLAERLRAYLKESSL